ncbi:MAG: hypothetical protein DI598_10005 [Pseudopedobacter saltans]|uniref:2'-5' RNA ligase family protein n=1 Tax=Pseudopedobacter saltans TaxID=151895 RepID=A0A2W5EWF5_9SPHI|nr:MAG: hypothetical protein DI598_10005 [Pseudopedobacter saltans]
MTRGFYLIYNAKIFSIFEEIFYMKADYFLIVRPDENTCEKVMSEKKRFSELYNCPSILHSLPHISLVRFINTTENESIIRNYLHRKISTFFPFLIEMEGFDVFPTHTIYVKIKNPSPIIDIVKNIKTEARILKEHSKSSIYFVTDRPHLTLARGLEHWQYENGWRQWQHVPFSARFEVSAITLLKKTGNRLRFDIVDNFSLSGMKNEVKQVSLF